MDKVGAPEDAGLERVKKSLLAYTDCINSEGARLALSNATPSEIAEAAHAGCLAELNSYQRTALRYLNTGVGSLNRKEESSRLISERSKKLVEDAKAHVIRLVVEERALATEK
ncbi:hypothetical protein B9G69_006775 [Bdellovibrio sp. SKB1291214]|uniref:hypothetical protein n=1 Tax=Bdellovibrio sp. SKB1291214 TaxID=1732569 RepID=UPI001C3E8613|nr:hypothetical protein [Bdellovibrio sp. SKB1291214]UYL10281.1 hypothetical protein B9G69_006775 [Bdellovibrio sp. SKB1291214]